VAYFVLLALLVYNWNTAPDENNIENNPSVNFIIPENSYSLPKVPKFIIENNTDTEVVVDTCEDFTYYAYANGRCATQAITNNLPPCSSHPLSSGETKTIIGDSDEDISYFQNDLTGGATFCVDYIPNTWEEETIVSELVTLKPQGGFKSLLSTIFYQPIYNAFVGIVQALPGKQLGWAIVIITIIIRLIILVPQQKMLVSQRKMQTIQPKIKDIQERHKWDQAKIGMEVMALYKKEWVNPLGSCLPLLIQMPFLLVLYWVIKDFGLFENRFFLYPFELLQSFTPEWVDSQFMGLNLLQKQWVQGIILALLVWGAQLAQIWLSQKRTNANKTPEQIAEEKQKKEEKKQAAKDSWEPIAPDPQQMAKMMLYILPIMIAIFSYTIEAGVGLYWLIGTLFMIVQQFIANKKVDKEDWATGGYELLDTKKSS